MSDLRDLGMRVNLLDADRIHRQTKLWVPLPHQVPPQGEDWYGWLMLAGRGAGKTDACANYVINHVNGPPCLPGPIPHWIGIIAPTLGDAATSCFSGPSGIRRYSPGAKMVNTTGGTIVRFPNGSEAKLFGAHSPEDVERLRSGGNRCISKGTLVRTSGGERPIEDIRPGEEVWTRNGLRRVAWSGLTRPNAETLIIRTDAGHQLSLTPDHRVWVVGHGWMEAQNVTPGSSMVAWNHLPRDLRHGTTGVRSGGVDARTVTTPTTTETSCTENSGRRTSVLSTAKQCSTTKITTKRTTTSAISSLSPEQSTARNIRKSGPMLDGSICRPATEAGSGHAVSGTTASHEMLSVTGVGSHSSPLGCELSSAEVPAVRVVVVQSVEHSSTRTDTYDLTVERDHEFFADDLIVHNCLNWLEELAAWRYLDDCWNHMRFGLRSGPRPHWVASTTPKPKPRIKKLSDGRMRNVVVTRASMYDNPYLPDDIKEALEEEYGGTQLGRQELYAEVLDQDENALWNRSMIDATRLLRDATPDMVRKSVGVDPSGGMGEQGIVVVGKAMIPREHDDPNKRIPLPHGYVLADRTVHLTPDGWGRRAVQAAIDYETDDICVEINYGGDMAVSTIRSAADAMGIPIPIRQVRATRGKKVRAQPVSALTEQGRWHMVGNWPELENQMCTWTPESDDSPDRLDAMVWPGWHQKIVKMLMTGGNRTGLGAMNQTIG